MSESDVPSGSPPEEMNWKKMYEDLREQKRKLETANLALRRRISDSPAITLEDLARRFTGKKESRLILFQDGTILVSYGGLIRNLGYNNERLEGTNINEIFSEVDRAIFSDGVCVLFSDRTKKKFVFGPGIVDLKSPPRDKDYLEGMREVRLLRPYNVSAELILEGGEYSYVDVKVTRESCDYYVQDPKAQVIVLNGRKKTENLDKALNEAVSKVKAEEFYHLQIHVKRSRFGQMIKLGPKVLGQVATLLNERRNVYLVGTRDLIPEEYTSLRDPKLNIPPGNLGLRERVFFMRQQIA